MRTLAPSIETVVVNSFNALLDAEVEPVMENGGGDNPMDSFLGWNVRGMNCPIK